MLAAGAVSADNTARVWDMEIGDCVLLLGGHMGPITNVAAAADGSMLITTSSDGSARLWELEKGECLAVLLGHSAAVRLSPTIPYSCSVHPLWSTRRVESAALWRQPTKSMRTGHIPPVQHPWQKMISAVMLEFVWHMHSLRCALHIILLSVRSFSAEGLLPVR